MRFKPDTAKPDTALGGEADCASLQEWAKLGLADGRAGAWLLELERPGRLWLSPELQQTFGGELQPTEALREVLSRIDAADRSRVLKSLLRSVRGNMAPQFDFRVTTKPLGAIWLSVRGKVYHDPDGRPVRVAGAAMDITPQKLAHLEQTKLISELQRRLVNRTDQWQSTNAEFESFCYSISHDLRAPLRSVRGFIEVLLERYAGGLDGRGQEFLRRASEASRSMDTLIESLLRLSRVSRGELQRRPLDLTQIASSIAAELAAAEPGRHVKVSVSNGLQASGDERLVRMALQNLLENAWKFTSQNPGAVIEVGELRSPEKAFYVRDNGAGFDPANQQRLFGMFQRLHSTTEFPGIGVGLAIVKRVITRHGGRVWASGEPQKGATFYFSLPTDETV